MKRKIVAVLAMLGIASTLTACGNSYYKDSGGHINAENAISESNISYALGGSYNYKEDSSIDYSNTSISGNFASYSYSIGSTGYLKSKSTALDFYEEVQKFVDNHDGYIDSVNNTYYTNDLLNDSYISENDAKYKAEGKLSFVVKVSNDNVDSLIKIFDTFSSKNNLYVSTYNQNIVNYKDVTIINNINDRDEYDYTYLKDHKILTQEELDEKIKYATVNVTVNYYLKRNPVSTFELNIRRFIDDYEEVFSSLIGIALVVFILLFIVVIPVYKILRKSIYKFNKKHPEYTTQKKVYVINETAATNQEVSNKVEDVVEDTLDVEEEMTDITEEEYNETDEENSTKVIEVEPQENIDVDIKSDENTDEDE